MKYTNEAPPLPSGPKADSVHPFIGAWQRQTQTPLWKSLPHWMTHRPLPRQGEVALLHCTLLIHLRMISRPLGANVLSMSKGRFTFPEHSSHPHSLNPYQLVPSAHSQTHRILELERISEAIIPYLCQDRACLAQRGAVLGPGDRAEQNSTSGVSPQPHAKGSSPWVSGQSSLV